MADSILEVTNVGRELADSELPPAIFYEPEINKLVDTWESLVLGADLQHRTSETYLLYYASNLWCDQYFIKCTAMLSMFDHYNVLDAYFDEANSTPTQKGWELRLRRPTRTGLFTVRYVEDPKTKVGEQRVYYAAA